MAVHTKAQREGRSINALVLQGGGALGAYQAGAYEALSAWPEPLDWVTGISIGSINAALIAQTVRGIADIRASSDGKEGVQSFLQKRKPSWVAG